MESLIVYPEGRPLNPCPRAYCQFDDGETWGPLWPIAYEEMQVNRASLLRPGQLSLNGSSFADFVTEAANGLPIARPILHPGKYYPRMDRTNVTVLLQNQPVVPAPHISATSFLSSFIGSLQQLESLFEALTGLFRVAHPEIGNLKAYGGAIRDLIILACTEVEAQWKGILKANNLLVRDDRYTTNEYVKLNRAMMLDSFIVALVRYPGLSEIKPFDGWDLARPTKSLAWYDVYNRVKHDREANFNEATLENAIKAVAACVVMLAAQFGFENLERYQLRNMFRFVDIPLWEAKNLYYGRVPGIPWEPIYYPF